jgi:hypothetical protein
MTSVISVAIPPSPSCGPDGIHRSRNRREIVSKCGLGYRQSDEDEQKDT